MFFHWLQEYSFPFHFLSLGSSLSSSFCLLKSFFSIPTQRELLPPAHSSPRSGGPGDEVTAETGEERGRDRPPGQSHTHSLRRNGTIHHARTANPDPSCLLTPPNTPLYPEGGGGGGGGGGPIIGSTTQTNGCSSRAVAECKKTNGLITNGLEGRLSDIQEVDKITRTHEQQRRLDTPPSVTF